MEQTLSQQLVVAEVQIVISRNLVEVVVEVSHFSVVENSYVF
jgi:hypothetical protein